MQDCLFCKIVNGKIPAEKVYEDEKFLAFMDLKPVNPGHVLLVPKNHYEDFVSASAEELQGIVPLMQKIAQAIMISLHYPACNISTNNGSEAGQVIKHLHFHIVPRREGDGHELMKGTETSPEELGPVAEKIKNNI